MYTVKIYTGIGKPTIVLDDKQQILLKLHISKSEDQPVGTFQVELAPIEQKGLTWIDVIPVNSYVEIRKGTKMKMVGLVTFVAIQSDIAGPQVRYTVKGSDLGLFFTKYFGLLSNKYLEGNQAGGASLAHEFQSNLAKVEAGKDSLGMLFPLLWDTFTNMFLKQINPSNPLKVLPDYFFSNGVSLKQMFGIDGGSFFEPGADLYFDYPLYTNLFKDGFISFYSLMEGWVTPYFNEFWMDTCDLFSPVQLDPPTPATLPTGTFVFFVRQSWDNSNLFNFADSKIIAKEKITSFMFQKTCEEMYSIYTTVADGAYNIGGSFNNGIVRYDTEALSKYGQQILEAHIKNAYAGSNKRKDQIKIINDHTKKRSIWHAGSEHLMDMYSNNDKFLAGTMNGVDLDVKIKEKVQVKLPFGDGIEKEIKALVKGVTESIDYTSPNPIPTVVLNIKRGVLA